MALCCLTVAELDNEKFSEVTAKKTFRRLKFLIRTKLSVFHFLETIGLGFQIHSRAKTIHRALTNSNEGRSYALNFCTKLSEDRSLRQFHSKLTWRRPLFLCKARDFGNRSLPVDWDRLPADNHCQSWFSWQCAPEVASLCRAIRRASVSSNLQTNLKRPLKK